MAWAILTDPKVGARNIGNGIWIGTPPKVGSPALIIDIKHRVGDWQFSNAVAKAVRDYGPSKPDSMGIWFQCIDRGNWLWSHGLVDHTGRITQIG